MKTNLYVNYYLTQQQGLGPPVFRGSLWQMGHGQMGYGLGNLFRSLAKVVMPLVKRGAKGLGKIVAKTGADLLGDITAGNNVKEAAKARGLEALGAAKTKALEHIQAKKHPGNNQVVEDAPGAVNDREAPEAENDREALKEPNDPKAKNG